MVNIAKSRLWEGIEPGEPQTSGALRVVPLLGPSSGEPSYRLFQPDGDGDVDIGEVSNEGAVPNIRVVNKLGDRLLLIDGEELLGAKQNRILNCDVLVAAGATVDVPVSCVESGRWHYHSRKFGRGNIMPRSARAAKSKDVFLALAAKRGHRADQHKVWDDVHKLIQSVEARSPSAAMADAYQAKAPELAGHRAELEMPDETVGIAVYEGDRLLGLDLFDRASTFRHYWSTLIDSYALDFIARQGTQQASPDAATPSVPVESLLQRLADAEWKPFDTPGEGRDLRFQCEGLTASALAFDDDAVLHVQALADF